MEVDVDISIYLINIMCDMTDTRNQLSLDPFRLSSHDRVCYGTLLIQSSTAEAPCESPNFPPYLTVPCTINSILLMNPQDVSLDVPPSKELILTQHAFQRTTTAPRRGQQQQPQTLLTRQQHCPQL